MTIDEIIHQLNLYNATHDTTEVSGPRVHNIWQDVILKLDGYDEELTSAYDTGQNDRFAVWPEGEKDAHVIAYDDQSGNWYDSLVLN